MVGADVWVCKAAYLGACNFEHLFYWLHACRYCIAFAVQFWKANQPLYPQTRRSWQNSRHRTALVTRADARCSRCNTGLARRRFCSPVFESISAWPEKLAVASTVHAFFFCSDVLLMTTLLVRGLDVDAAWQHHFEGLLYKFLWFCCVESVCWTVQMFASCLVTLLSSEATGQWLGSLSPRPFECLAAGTDEC